MPFRMTDKLVEVGCEWDEREIVNEGVFLGATFGVISDSIPLRNYDEVICIMQQATSVPKNTEISYHDQVHLIDYVISSVDLFLHIRKQCPELLEAQRTPKGSGSYESF